MKTDGCRFVRTQGKTFTIFAPASSHKSKKIKDNPTVNLLATNFDYVIAQPAEHCFTPEQAKVGKCKRGIEVTAIRKENILGSEQEEADRGFIFSIAGGVGKFKKPVVLDINDNITFYGFNCESKKSG